MCPSCTLVEETRNHFFCCPARKWTSDFFPDLTRYLSFQPTNPILADILQTVLRCLLRDQPVDLPRYPKKYLQLIKKQRSIGWQQLLLGRFVNEWSMIQSDFQAVSTQTQPYSQPTTWVTGLITLIWTHLYNNWAERNKDKHGSDATTQELALLHQAQQEITATYALKHRVLPRDRDVFYDSPTHHFTQEPTSKKLRQWINTWKPTILRSVAACEKQGLQAYASIRSFFTPGSRPHLTRNYAPPPLLHTHPPDLPPPSASPPAHPTHPSHAQPRSIIPFSPT